MILRLIYRLIVYVNICKHFSALAAPILHHFGQILIHGIKFQTVTSAPFNRFL